MIFFQLFNWFQLFFYENEIPKTKGQSQNTNDLFEWWCRWLQLFFIDFQLLYFLSKIIPVLSGQICILWKIRMHE